MSFIKEFKEFAMKGNVVDMAVGIIIGGAFGKIVSSIVNDIIMPPIGLLMGGVNFTDLKLTLKAAQLDAATNTMKDAVTLNYGQFLQTTLDFLILTFAIFLMIKAMNSMKKKEEAKPAAPPMPPREEILLTEIRDILSRK
ncbi:MAG TPA: large-conductance mechanosensitive channel protein MscL [Candidatus Omnitrophota bacterium]|nr:large-conductance mechanosensitive channel protein MscL [Candidatus Omnitrophota bacterium]